MAENHVVSALVAKRAELSGEIEGLDQQRAAIQSDIDSIDAVLALCGYKGDPETIRAKRKRKHLFARRELPQLIAAIKAEATGPLYREDIAAQVIARKGWTQTPKLLEEVADKVRTSQKRRRKKLCVR